MALGKEFPGQLKAAAQLLGSSYKEDFKFASFDDCVRARVTFQTYDINDVNATRPDQAEFVKAGKLWDEYKKFRAICLILTTHYYKWAGTAGVSAPPSGQQREEALLHVRQAQWDRELDEKEMAKKKRKEKKEASGDNKERDEEEEEPSQQQSQSQRPRGSIESGATSLYNLAHVVAHSPVRVARAFANGLRGLQEEGEEEEEEDDSPADVLKHTPLTPSRRMPMPDTYYPKGWHWWLLDGPLGENIPDFQTCTVIDVDGNGDLPQPKPKKARGPSTREQARSNSKKVKIGITSDDALDADADEPLPWSVVKNFCLLTRSEIKMYAIFRGASCSHQAPKDGQKREYAVQRPLFITKRVRYQFTYT